MYRRHRDDGLPIHLVGLEPGAGRLISRCGAIRVIRFRESNSNSNSSNSSSSIRSDGAFFFCRATFTPVLILDRSWRHVRDDGDFSGGGSGDPALPSFDGVSAEPGAGGGGDASASREGDVEFNMDAIDLSDMKVRRSGISTEGIRGGGMSGSTRKHTISLLRCVPERRPSAGKLTRKAGGLFPSDSIRFLTRLQVEKTSIYY